jgi:hypothetical protein
MTIAADFSAVTTYGPFKSAITNSSEVPVTDRSVNDMATPR